MRCSIAPCSTLALPVFAPVASAATRSASSTTTLDPPRCSMIAVASPVMPAPTTATSKRSPGITAPS